MGRAVPKYLNTAETGLFTKGHELYGLTEAAEALTAGAVPVLVEGLSTRWPSPSPATASMSVSPRWVPLSPTRRLTDCVRSSAVDLASSSPPTPTSLGSRQRNGSSGSSPPVATTRATSLSRPARIPPNCCRQPARAHYGR